MGLTPGVSESHSGLWPIVNERDNDVTQSHSALWPIVNERSVLHSVAPIFARTPSFFSGGKFFSPAVRPLMKKVY
jgi:hypothetical protein